MRRIAALVVCGLLIFSVSIFLETRTEWPWDILQSLGAAGVILLLGLIRGRAREEESDQLWIIAFWYWLTEQLASAATRFQTAVKESAPKATDGAQEPEAGKVADTGTPGTAPETAPMTAQGPEEPRGREADVTERDGSLVKTVLWFHERYLRPDPPGQDTQQGG